MKNNQKGFVNIVLIGAIVVLLALGGLVVWSKKSSQVSNKLPTTSSILSFVSPVKNDVWEIGDPHQIIFNQGLPYESHCSNAIYLIDSTGKKVGAILVENLENQVLTRGTTTAIWNGKYYANSLCGTGNESQTTKPGVYRLELLEQDTIYATGKDIDVYSDYFTLQDSTNIKDISKPFACKQDPEAIPVISPLSNSVFSVGDTIKIHGCNLAGFEGDNNIWVENKDGVKGILYGIRRNDNENIEITLTSSACEEDNSYTGWDCKKSMTLISGVYKIYTIPWGKKSNLISITIK